MDHSDDLPDDMFLVHVTGEDDGTMQKTLSFSRSPTVLLSFAANRFTRAASRVYQDKYGLGSMDWRILVMLTREPGATVTRASDMIGIDKGAVSRSLHRLLDQGLVRQGDLHANGRSRSWRLTGKGQALHARILEEALTRQRALFKGFHPEEITQLCDLLTRFMVNLDDLQDR
ncbi:MarR family winged helix-turn-helix transcriptional regulator [Paracoccus sp. (in: a-proteobacteria)]|uniref:MarR family winged helix-turn-helix transcriptional regulator n=1 Tax=Paracoccus sp. TaxID=267 RepID=UPI003A8B82E0